jgi:hypothetical protein
MTAKQEAFALAYVENGGNASKAYRAVYNAQNMTDETVWVKACEALKVGKVAVRVAELRAKITEKAETKLIITVELLTKMTKDAYDLAAKCEKPQTSAMVKASEFLGKLHGLVTEKSETKVTLSQEDRLRLIKQDSEASVINGHASH